MDEGHFDHAAEICRALLESREDASALFQRPDQTFDDVAAAVRVPIKLDSAVLPILAVFRRNDRMISWSESWRKPALRFLVLSLPNVWYNSDMAISMNSALDRLLEPLTDCLTPDVARRIVAFRADAETQHRVDELAAKANEGTLTEAEQAEYQSYVEAIDLVSILQAKARTVLGKFASA
jgi:hypothetical protein